MSRYKQIHLEDMERWEAEILVELLRDPEAPKSYPPEWVEWAKDIAVKVQALLDA